MQSVLSGVNTPIKFGLLDDSIILNSDLFFKGCFASQSTYKLYVSLKIIYDLYLIPRSFSAIPLQAGW